jgi:hypothetical protein
MTPDTALHPWLQQFPAEAQPLIVAWFAYAAGHRPATPEGLLQVVERLVGHKLDWSTTPVSREACTRALLALRHQRPGALAYAQTFLTQEVSR